MNTVDRYARLLFLTCLVSAFEAFAQARPFDVLIENGRIVDGTGNPWYVADVGIRDGIIVEIGTLTERAALRVIDARNLTVAPGFIDMMGGSSLPLLLDPVSAESKLRQGVTTIMAGEGESLAPQNEHTMRELTSTNKFNFTWHTYGEYFQRLEEKGIGLNVIHNVGAAQIRRVVIGDEDRSPTNEQLREMKELVAQAMRDGAIGVSTALIYPPGAYAKTEEIIELATVAAQHGGVYFTHMRNESGQLLDAIREAIRIGEDAHLPVHIYHLKAAGEENWPLMTKALQLIREARDRGIDVTADIYPYIRNGIGLGSFIHPRHYALGRDAFVRTLSDRNVRATLRHEIETTSDWENWYRHVGKNWDNVLVVHVPANLPGECEGKSIQEIAAARGTNPWQVFFDLIEQGDVDVNPKSMNEEQKQEALRAEFVSVGSDAEPMNPSTATYAHPRTFGTFPRILAKYVRAGKVISLENAIREMASLPANQLKLRNRGHISPGMAADLVVFDPSNIKDTATFAKPLSYSIGVEYVLVNGQVAIDSGRATQVLAGQVLRSNR